jgi:hypothetical protein
MNIIGDLGAAIDAIRINTHSRETRDGRVFLVKRRNRASGFVMRLAQGFFRLANNPARVLADAAEWQRWEVECFELLNGGAFRAFAEGGAVFAEVLPGKSLSDHLDARTLTPAMLAAAAGELRRAHALRSEAFDGPWSHGDPHLGNIIYDGAAGRARLVDFELMHDRALFPNERHADDLLIPLLDMAGRIERPLWLPCALALVTNYGRPEILARLHEWLRVPCGWERLWWAVRTSYMGTDELEARLAELRAHF